MTPKRTLATRSSSIRYLKTTKFYTALLSLLLLAATAISLASCNKDDDHKES